MSRPQVLVVGSVNVDLVVRVATLPAPGETVGDGRFAEADGGKGANQAAAAARAGADVRFVGAVGDDAHGRRAHAALAGEGVALEGLAVVDAPTGVALIAVGAGGENQIAVAPGANAHVDPAAAARAVDALDPARSVLLLGLEVPDAPALAAARRAAARGVAVVLDPAPARPFAPELERLGPLLTPNEREAAALAGAPEPAPAARALSARTGGAVVLTLGAAGALVLAGPDADPVQVAAPPVTAVDATGAGDVLCGVLAAALAGGAGLVDAVVAAVAAASASAGRRGARG